MRPCLKKKKRKEEWQKGKEGEREFGCGDL
jgi:hypothetical protein